MMSMMVAVRVHGVHILWQYTNLNTIWQALMNEDVNQALLNYSAMVAS